MTMEINPHRCPNCETEMTLLDATETVSGWKALIGEFGLNALTGFAVEAVILVVTLACAVAFGPFWLVVGFVALWIAWTRKGRTFHTMALTYKCPACGKVLSLEKTVVSKS